MPLTTVDSLNRSAQETQIWLKQLRDGGQFSDEEQAFSALRSVLHAVRDNLTPDEAAHLASELPVTVRGVYYERWKPAAAPAKDRSQEEFLERVQRGLPADLQGHAPHAVSSVFQLLADRLGGSGELDHVKGMLHADVRQLWP